MRVKSASCGPTAADRAHEYPHQILSMRSLEAADSAIEKDFFLFFFFHCRYLYYFVHSELQAHHRYTNNRDEEEGGHGGRGQHRCRRQSGDAAAEAGWLTVWPTHNGTTEMSQGNQACDGSSTVVARSTRWTIYKPSYFRLCPSYFHIFTFELNCGMKTGPLSYESKFTMINWKIKQYVWDSTPWLSNIEKKSKQASKGLSEGAEMRGCCWEKRLRRGWNERNSSFLVVMVCFILWDFVLWMAWY